jgi:DNA-binding NarL/FixJ family response regulator
MAKLKILLVDDNPAIFAALEEILLEFDIVGMLTRGMEVVAKAEQLKPDVIVLDISLGDVNGYEVATALKTNRSSARIVFLTIHEGAEFVRKGFECGASGV